jgi:hypothetical protein
MPRVVAQADLALLQERMAATVARAKTEDPRELRQRIAQLEAALQTATHTKPAPVEVEVPVVQPAQLSELREVVASLERIIDFIGTALGRVSVSSRPREAPRVESRAPPPPPVRSRSSSPRVAVDGDHAGEVPLRAGERKMLETLVRHHPMKMTRAQLGTIAGFTASGGTFGAYFGTLRRRGLLIEGSDGVGASPAGLDEGGGGPAEPQSTEEILAMWRSILRAGERKMLDALIDARPDSLTRDELGARSGFEARGGTFGAYLGTLRRNGLADVSGDLVRVSEALFLTESARSRRRANGRR